MRKTVLAILLTILLAPLYPSYAATTATPGARLTKIENKMENIASRTAALKAKLLLFKDQKKAALVQKINDNLVMINKNRTDQMTKHLDTMSKILTKLETYVSSLTGKDTTNAKQAIDEAKTAIDSAKTAVDLQSKKDYTIVATGEATIRKDAKAKRDELHIDLQATRKIVIDAKKAVSDAIMIVATTLKGGK